MDRNSRFGYLTEYSASQMIDEIGKQARGFATSYEREVLWHLLKRESLSNKQRKELEAIALRLLERGVNREFWPMLRAMRVQGSKAFWLDVLHMASRYVSDKPLYKQGRVAATLLIAALMSHETQISARTVWRKYKKRIREGTAVDLRSFRGTLATDCV
jgi:hypothetical protein